MGAQLHESQLATWYKYKNCLSLKIVFIYNWFFFFGLAASIIKLLVPQHFSESRS